MVQVRSQLPKSTLLWGVVMWKKWLAFAGMLALIILLDPTHTPAQPGGGKGGFGGFGPGGGGNPGGGWGGFGGFGPPGGGGQPGAVVGGQGGGQPGAVAGGQGGTGNPNGGFGGPGGGFGGWGGGPGGGMGGPGGGFGGPGGGMGGPGGGRRDPEQSWMRLQNATGSTGDTVDLSKIPPQQAQMMKMFAERSGGKALPETGIMTKTQFLELLRPERSAAGGERRRWRSRWWLWWPGS